MVYGEFFQFRECRCGNALWFARTFASVVLHLRDRGMYLQPQTHDRGRDKTERILQAEEQILERDEEEPDISTRQLLAEVGDSQFVEHRT